MQVKKNYELKFYKIWSISLFSSMIIYGIYIRIVLPLFRKGKTEDEEV